MKIFVPLNECFYRVHFRRFPNAAVDCETFVLDLVSVALLWYVASGCHPLLDSCFAELPSAFLSHSLVASINLPIHSHILVMMNLSCGIQGHLSIVLLVRIALNLGWISLRLELLLWLIRVAHFPILLLGVNFDFSSQNLRQHD